MNSRFAPLSTAEIDAAPVPFNRTKDGELVSPVPADAPAAPAAHYCYGNPVAVWKYYDAQGALLFEVHRFEKGGRKEIVPMTLWRIASGRMEWRPKGFPAPRPLYNLDKLASHPETLVVVVEGEKAAEAAARVFPDCVATTSPGGAMAANKADWKVLAGRRVTIWPDADAPGLQFAADVAGILSGLGCNVSVIDGTALAALSPDGSKRNPTAGWDAADAATEWADLTAFRDAALALAKPFQSGPSYLSWGPFTMDADGLTVEVTKGKGDAAETSEEWVCSAFELLGATRDQSGRDWGKWLRWHDGDGRLHHRHVSEASLQADPASLAATLAGEGLRVNRAHQRALANYLAGVETKGRVCLVERTGWASLAGHDLFVLPASTIGPSGSETVILDAAAAGPYSSRGTLEEWQAGVGAYSAGHALAVFAVSTALAGPLLHLAGQEGGGVNIFGESSKGKTTVLQAAASVWGRGGSPGFVRAWRATANGLEAAAASATDTCLVLDELGVVEARDAAAAVYGLSNGSGKARAARDGGLREPKSWRVLVLSTGEIPIATKLSEEKGRRVRAGQEVRLLDIPADRGLGFGAFDNAGPDGDAGKVSKALKLSAVSSYGTAGPEFVRRLISEGVDGETVRAMVADFVSAEIPAGADGQIDRAAQRLGLIAAAGELATALGVTPWQEGAATAAAAWALARWIEGRGGTEPAEVRQAIETVRLAIQQHGESRFEPLDGRDAWRPMGSRLGWRTGEGAEQEWLVPAEIWKSEICAGLDPKAVARVLGERGMLERASDGWQAVRRIDGRSTRVFVLLASIFEGAGNGD